MGRKIRQLHSLTRNGIEPFRKKLLGFFIAFCKAALNQFFTGTSNFLTFVVFTCYLLMFI